MKVHLIRHGLTVPGEEGRYQGFLDEGLSAKGRAALLTAPQHPSRVYVSPARRARQTAAILYPAAEQICVPGLQEMNFGVFEGRTAGEMEDDAQYRAWVDSMCLDACPGGESRAVFSERRWGRPARDYYSWQRPCGCGWLLALKESQACGGIALSVLAELKMIR